MKRVSVIIVVMFAVGLAACQQAAPERTASGSHPEAPAPPEPPATAAPPPAPQPALTSRPAPDPRILPAGTALPLVLRTGVASNTSQVGDRVVAALGDDVSVEGRVILAAGTEVAGHVTVAMQSGRVKGRARLAHGVRRGARRWEQLSDRRDPPST